MANQLFPSDAAQRLVWRIPAPLETAISVSANSRAPRGVSEPYCSQTLSSGSWHLIAQEPISMTPCSSITVQTPLESWPTQWEERHEHADPDDDGCEFAPDDHDGPGELLRCCGEDRPEAPEPFVVTATSKEYVTIHDYVSTAHAWLMDNFEQVSAAYNIWDDGVAPPGQKLFVLVADLQRLDVADEPTWKLLADTVQQPLPPVANPGARYDFNTGKKGRSSKRRAASCPTGKKGWITYHSCPQSGQSKPMRYDGEWPYLDLDPKATDGRTIQYKRDSQRKITQKSGIRYSCDAFPPATWVEGGEGTTGNFPWGGEYFTRCAAISCAKV